MTLQEAYATLIIYQQWRKGADIVMIETNEVTEAIDVILKNKLHDQEFLDFETKPGFVERRMAHMHKINDHQWNNIYDLYNGTSDLHEFIDWLKQNYISPEKI